MKKRVLIATVGTGDTSYQPVIKSIKDSRADEAILIRSDDDKSAAGAQKVVDECKDINVFIQIIKDENNPNETYKTGLEAVLNCGADIDEVYINYTAGTKAMTAGLVLAGVMAGCRNFFYVGGSQRDKETGRVKSGFMDKVNLSSLTFVSIDYGRKKIIDFFNSQEFIAAEKVMEDLKKDYGTVSNHEDENLFFEEMIKAYKLWSMGSFEEAAGSFKKITVKPEYKKRFAPGFEKQIYENKAVINMLNKNLHMMVFERAAAALRAKDKGYFNLAAEYIYSALECMAHLMMLEIGIDKSKVNPEKLKNLGIDFSDLVAGEQGIGLWKAFQILDRAKNKLAGEIVNDSDLLNDLKTRNEMIHGGKMVTEKQADKFFESASKYFEKYLCEYAGVKEKKLQKFLEKFRFPKL